MERKRDTRQPPRRGGAYVVMPAADRGLVVKPDADRAKEIPELELEDKPAHSKRRRTPRAKRQPRKD